jgi:hypothetical protein
VERRGVELTLDTRAIDPDGYWPQVAVVDDLGDVATRLVRVLTTDLVLLRECALDDRDAMLGCAPAVAAEPRDWEEEEVVTLVELLVTFRAPDGQAFNCRLDRCALVVTTDADGQGAPVVLAGAELVFGTAGRPGTIAVSTPGPVDAGDRVSVALTGFHPGERLTLAWCAPPGPVEREACGAPAPTTVVTIGPDGRATADLRSPAEGTGPGTHRCGPRRPCAVAVTEIGRAASIAVVPVAFVGPPGPDLPAGRVAVGLGLAAALLVAAVIVNSGTRTARGLRGSGEDPFDGVTLDVPEWDAIDLNEADAADDLVTLTTTS